MNQEIIKVLIEAVVTIIGLLLTGYVIPFIKEKIGAEKYEKAVEFCSVCIRSAEQVYSQEEWLLKKAYVLDLVSEYCNKIGLGLNEAEIDALIEGLVNSIKHN